MTDTRTQPPALIVLAKAPAPGVAKTRLSPPLTLAAAAAFAAAALADTVAVARAVPGCAVRIAHPQGAESAIRAALGAAMPPCVALPAVATADVGAAMAWAMACAFDGGVRCVALIGGDLPSLPPAYIAAAFAALDRGADVALGPAEDGGYYLVATREPQPELFAGIAWSTPAVFAQTAARAASLGLAVATLPPWYDIDGATDLLRCARDLDADAAHPARATRAFLAAHAARLHAHIAE